MDSYVVRPIGLVRSERREKVEAPRQAVAAPGQRATIEVAGEHEHALADLDGFDRIWVIFLFHLAAGPSPSKVLPPRSREKRGVFATRSPHRPNPIGLSAVRLERIEGRVLFVRDVDLLDGTPVLDLKPYLAYADAFPDASAGWLAAPSDPRPSYDVRFSAIADAQLAYIDEHDPREIRRRIVATLTLGPQPHPYRRIRLSSARAGVLAIKSWRATFEFDGRDVEVTAIKTGYRPSDLARGKTSDHDLHRAFVARFGG